MNSNFNIVQKSKKEDIEEEVEEVELEEEKVEKKKAANAKKRMLTMMGIIVGITVVLLLVLFLFSIFFQRTYSYTELENLLKDAAVDYFELYPESLPSEDGKIVQVDSSNLVEADTMKDLSEYTEEGVVCSGSVQVERAGSGYLYTPYLNCGENYVTQEFYKKITNSKNLVTSGYGLYAVNGTYVYRGEDVNNYVQLEESLWRIVKVTSNNNVVLISDKGIEVSQPWDDRYNSQKKYVSGFNKFSTSRMKEYLDNVYDNPNEKMGELLLSKEDKAKTVKYNVCTGKKVAKSTKKDNSEECSEVLPNQKWGLLTLSDYLYASIDENCTSALSKSCQNYNYLKMKDYQWWLVTGDASDSSQVFSVQSNGVVELKEALDYKIVRPVIYLNSKVLYKSGKGTLEKPYKIK